MAARRDILAALAQVRHLESGLARRQLAEDADRLTAAGIRAETADAALRTEQAAGAPADYAAWVGKGLAERERTALGVAHAAERHGQARAALTAARVAERCIERLREDCASAERTRHLRKAQAATDDAAGRRFGADRP